MSTDHATLTFHGAAGTVTGSRHLIEIGGNRILLDAGLFQGKKKLRLRNWEGPGFHPPSIDHVLISHTHIDHIGYLPRLVKQGLKAPVYLTPPAFDLAELMLLDAAKIQEEDARYANKKGFSKHKPALPLYDRDDARRALALRQRVEYGRWLELPGTGAVRARFINAGHLLGSSFLELRIHLSGRELTVVYSADIGRYGVPLHVDPEPPPECDVMLLESTYGDRLHTTESLVQQVAEPFNETLRQGGTVLIPSFAVGRSQLVTLVLRRLIESGDLPDVPIHIDSPMAVEATRIYSRHLGPENVDEDVYQDGRMRLFPRRVHFHRSVGESKRLNRLDGPRILISSSGMLTGGRILHHVKRLAGDSKNLIALVGYQAEGTRGRHLLEDRDTVKIHGQQIKVRCRVMSVHGLSGHGDQQELIDWVASGPRPPRRVYMVHGEPKPARTLAGLLEQRFDGLRAEVAGLGQEVDLTAF